MPHSRKVTAEEGPLSGSSAYAWAVPSACELAPMLMPLATGSLTLKAFNSVKPKFAPTMPSSTTLIAVTADAAPRASAIGSAMGSVMKRGASPRQTAFGSPASLAKKTVPTRDANVVHTPPPTMGSRRLLSRALCSNSPNPRATTAGGACDSSRRPGPPGARYALSALFHPVPSSHPLRHRQEHTIDAPVTMGGSTSLTLWGSALPACSAATERATTAGETRPAAKQAAETPRATNSRRQGVGFVSVTVDWAAEAVGGNLLGALLASWVEARSGETMAAVERRVKTVPAVMTMRILATSPPGRALRARGRSTRGAEKKRGTQTL
mmetsp:Transcript_13344/g.30905  ORF Transcript_13344/g.30905 Transcript_13344/m.30905 type:complete len:324 (-) Transcript_13344:750-1721(-)